MKNKTTTKLMAMLLSAIMVFSVSCTALNTNSSSSSTNETQESAEPEHKDSSNESVFPENGAKKILLQERKVYSSADDMERMTFAHYADTPDILLIDTATACDFVFGSLLSEFADFDIAETDTTLTVTKDNGSYCVLDFVKDSIYFNDFDLFRARFDSMSDLLMSQYVDSQGNEIYFRREGSRYIAGNPIYIDLASRDIPLDVYEGKKYIPFQTLNDLFIAPYEIVYLFNSKDVFRLSPDGTLDPALEEEFYSMQPSARSEALANYTLNELCLVLDFYYGLKEEHGITDGFKSYLERIGLLDDLLSPDPAKANTALANLMVGYLADQHSDLIMASPYTGSPILSYRDVEYNSSILHYFDYYEMLTSIRAEMMPDGVLGYQEIDNTAYVTFDSFTLSPDRYLDYSEESDQIDDTIGLIIEAHRMINRKDSPIENVVLDLSCNGGGYVDALVYVVAWMLGSCNLYITNPVTNSSSTTAYTVDVNLDGIFDQNDSIADKNLYCLTSPLSFSASNTAASLFKKSGMVTLIGNATGGGSCAVQLTSAADGSLFMSSTSYRNAAFYNGSYYDIDTGIAPHVYLSKFEHYFDRNFLTEYINDLK